MKGLMSIDSRVFYIPLKRRRFLKSIAVASAGFTLPGYLAEALTLTPQQEQGPYYPLQDNVPLDKDNDLVVRGDSLTPASGTVTYISGKVLDSNGNPIRGALVELWHADVNGYYVYSSLHPRNPHVDPNFAGFGQFLTRSNGAYGFRTITPGLYVGRARHFHFGITIPGQLTRFTTETFWDEPQPNGPDGQPWPYTPTNDPVLNNVSDPTQRASVILSYSPVPGTTTGEVQTTYDFVMGLTPAYSGYPGGGSLLISGAMVPGPTSTPRFMLRFPAYTGYTYEVYGNPTMANLSWSALPFSLSQLGSIDAHKFTAASDGTLSLYVEKKATKGFYYVSYRVPGANTGTP